MVVVFEDEETVLFILRLFGVKWGEPRENDWIWRELVRVAEGPSFFFFLLFLVDELRTHAHFFSSNSVNPIPSHVRQLLAFRKP